MKTLNIFIFIRVGIGGLFLISGLEKVLSPYQNFLYVVQGYQAFPGFLEEIVARVVPWIEVFLGLFLVLGLWLKETLMATELLFFSFICIVAQALLRKIPLEECGCFGQLISLPPEGVIVMDTVLLILTILMVKKINKTSVLSLDQKFQ